MESQRFCVYNLTRETLLGLQVAELDSTAEPLKKLIESLFAFAETGLWLMPYRGIPSVPGLAPFDLVCLDEERRVIQEIERFSTAGYVQLEPNAASALVLPARTLHSSHTHPGDQLVICFPEEMERRFEPVPGEGGRVHLVPRADSRPTTLSGNGSSPTIPNGSAGLRLDQRLRQEQLAAQMLEQTEEAEPEETQKRPLRSRLMRMLVPDRRRATRHPARDLVAYRWTGSTPRAQRLADISDTGLFLLTDERWLPGTMITMTLQRANSTGEDPADSIAVQTKVVRWGANGEGLDFVLSSSGDVEPNQTWRQGGTSKKALRKFLQNA
jgi:hypothetical protein